MQKCAAVPKNRCEKCIGPVMHEQMPAYTVYIGKTGAFYMKKWKTRGISLLLALVLITGGTTAAFPGQSFAENVEIESPAACLMELTTGKILYEKEADTRRSPASVTKIMTTLLIMEAIKSGKITLQDEVVTSAHAKSMGGSQVFLEEGEKQTVDTLLKCILVASGNDASVAMAEYIGGSEEAFVQKMNEEAKALGATNTNFVNPHGLHDPQQYTTAYDLYLMFNACSKNPTFIDIISQKSYSATITSADGDQWTTEWIPTNYYSAGEATPPEGVNVLGGKTGTTDEAGSCVILYNQDMDSNPYISVIMGADTKTILYDDMTALLAAGVGTKSAEN